jgi:hypothetical protein
MGLLTEDVLGGLGKVQEAARFSNGGASASRRTKGSFSSVVLGDGTAWTRVAARVTRIAKEGKNISGFKVGRADYGRGAF